MVMLLHFEFITSFKLIAPGAGAIAFLLTALSEFILQVAAGRFGNFYIPA